MNYLVVYGSLEGHTAKIAVHCAERLGDAGHDVRLIDAVRRVEDLALTDYDACLIAAPVHQQRHPDAVFNFILAHLARLNAMPSAFVSVSLSAAFADGRSEARLYIDRLLERTAWKPIRSLPAAGALRYAGYDFFQEQIIRHIVLKDRAPQGIAGDHDFTDWPALDAFIDDFSAAAANPRNP